MKHAYFSVHLKQPVIVSEQAATAGAHHSLDYLPGAMFLGVAASRLYAEMAPEEAFTVFHSGQVRFSDALPLVDGELALPVPFSWHIYKGESKTCSPEGSDAQVIDSNQVFDPSDHPKMASPGRQPLQLRDGYVTATGLFVEPVKEQTLKTAINRKTGTASDGQLFGYEALSAGQEFGFTLQAEDGLPDALWEKLLAIFDGPVRLGRSRSAQFGRAVISPAADKWSSDTTVEDDNILTLWLTSDLWLQENGQPCLIPYPRLIGLPESSRWLADRSFLRSRRYSSYNGYRRHYDPERQLIARGSVLRFELPSAPDELLLERLAKGIGLGQEDGNGQVLVNPAILVRRHPAFTDQVPVGSRSAVSVRNPDTLLTRVLASRAAAASGAEDAVQRAWEIYAGLCKELAKARRYNAIPAGERMENAPGRSQWGRLREAANAFRNEPARLWQALDSDDDAILRDRTRRDNTLDSRSGGHANGWEIRTGSTDDAQLGTWLRKQLENIHKNHSNSLPRLVGLLANHGLSDDWNDRCEGRQSATEVHS